jgi:hypothetical protein
MTPRTLKEKAMKKTITLISIVLLALFSCITHHIPNIDEEKNRQERKIENYNGSTQKSIENRILIVPPVILDYLNKMDSTDKYKPYEPTNDEKQLFLDYFNLLPRKYKQVIEKKLVAVYFIQNFIGGGMSDFLFDQNGNLYTALYLNPDVLHTKLNDWITYRDNSTFTEDGSTVKIEVDCGNGYFGLLHTLMHEGSHIFDYHYHITPYVEPVLMTISNTKMQTPFIDGIWKDYGHPFPMYDFENRTNVSGYGLGKKLPREFAVALYTNLNKTPFSSLYGSSAWVEDFAETFTWYFLNKYLKIKYVVTIYKENREILHFSPTDNKMVMNRYDQFQSILE